MPFRCKPLFDGLTAERFFAIVTEPIYPAGYGIQPYRSRRAIRPAGRLVAVTLLAAAACLALAVVAHGGSGSGDSTVVVQRGDTLWSIAAAR